MSNPEVWFDLRTCQPTSASNCKLAAVQPGYAARRGNELKEDAWVEVAAAQGSSFIPLTHEAFGRMGKPASDFINTMAIKAQELFLSKDLPSYESRISASTLPICRPLQI